MRIAVTGAASGIGSVIADELSSSGAHVAICDKDAERVQAFAADHEDIFAMVANVSEEADVINFFNGVEAKLGGLDALINNAGIAGLMTSLEQFDFADWQETISVNLNGTFLCSKEAIPMLRAAGGGSIINIGSTSSFFGTPLRSAYSATKCPIPQPNSFSNPIFIDTIANRFDLSGTIRMGNNSGELKLPSCACSCFNIRGIDA